MNKKTRTLLLIILFLVVAVVGSRSLWQGESAAGKTAVSGEQNPGSGDNPSNKGSSSQPAEEASAGSGLPDTVGSAVGEGRPVVLVFTYNADCCPSTKEFFEKHRAVVKRLEQKFSPKANFVWIDVAFYGETDNEGLLGITKKYGVTAIPAVVLIDAKGNPNSVIPGELNEKSVDAKLEGLVKGF